MGRTGEAENQAANTQLAQEQTAAYKQQMDQTAKFNTDVGTLKSGKNIGANPFATPTYLANENRDAATASGAVSAGAKAQLADAALRTGDNSASTNYAIKNQARTAQQDANTALMGQHSQDYLSNLNWQQGLLGNDLGAASATGQLYGTATSGRADALNNLTQFGLASYGPINSLVGAAGVAGGAALGKYCWISAAVFDGWDDPRTMLTRLWLFNEFNKRPVGKILTDLYVQFGERLAEHVRTNRVVRSVMTVIFNNALDSARKWADSIMVVG